MTLKKALIGAFVLSWLLLLAWAFQDVRVFVRVHIAHFLGWHSGVVPEQTSEAIELAGGRTLISRIGNEGVRIEQG